MPRSSTDLIIIHCSATKPSMDWGVREIDREHRRRGFTSCGYHFVIKRDGTVETGRPMDAIGAHAYGFNRTSVGICLIGGVSERNAKKPEQNYTPEQWASLAALVAKLQADYPKADVVGHNELTNKACPSFSVDDWQEGLQARHS